MMFAYQGHQWPIANPNWPLSVNNMQFIGPCKNCGTYAPNPFYDNRNLVERCPALDEPDPDDPQGTVVI